MSKLEVNQFSIEVERRVADSGESYITTILALAEELEIDEDDVPKFIGESLKQRLYVEALNERTIKSKNRIDSEDLSRWI